jgi:hypothetical protein
MTTVFSFFVLLSSPSSSSSSHPMYGFMFNTSMKEKKNKRNKYLEKRKEAKKEKTVSCCYLMVNQ